MYKIKNYFICLVKKIAVIVATFTFSYLLVDLLFNKNYLSIISALYITYCVHIVIKYHSEFYAIPYNHKIAYDKCLNNYYEDNKY